MKGVGSDEQIGSQRCKSTAAQFNAKVLRKLRKAFAANSDTDLLSIFPAEYSVRLGEMKKQKAGKGTCLIFYMD